MTGVGRRLRLPGTARSQDLPAAQSAAPDSGQAQELRAKLLETRAVLGDKLEAARVDNQALKAKVVEVREQSNAKVAEVREQSNARVAEVREQLGAKVEALQAENRELKHTVARYERRHLMKNVDAVAHNRPSAMDDFFAEIEDETPYRRFGAALREELSALGVELDGRTVADTGVGPGIALHELLQGASPREVVGYDFSAKAIEHARRLLPDARFEVRTVEDVPTERFDVVVCTEVLEHLEDPREALVGLAQLLADGGTLVLTVPDGRIDFSEKHINFWSPEGWSLFLRQVLPDHEVRTSVFAPYPETGHQTNLGLVHRR